ncbi:TetR/AcrR family transcriptional regulator [Neobacillus sp. LXY-4]|uniref:TetR/AcrR family transcriptional regulator n=1 Tax=Neobacillus sp. LXY-4 TaxID=3379826 RepID=UPI003EE1E59F
MNDRKQHVIKTAHHLFIEKGFQNTSIQDIIEHSGISKGTFYNYFSSKNELLIALFKMIYKKLEQDRNELLMGQDPANIEIFIKQIEMQMKTNRANKLVSLFEEVNFSNDVELKQFIKLGNLRMLGWLYYRFIDLFGEDKKPYLLDCAIMFMGILQHNIKFNAMAYDMNTSVHHVVRYSVDRIVKLVSEVAETGAQLIPPELLENKLPNCKKQDQSLQLRLVSILSALKKTAAQFDDQSKRSELLDFIQDELLHVRKPRIFLIESALSSLRNGQSKVWVNQIEELESLIEDFRKQLKDEMH